MGQNINTWSCSTKSKASFTDCINTILCIWALPLLWRLRLQVIVYWFSMWLMVVLPRVTMKLLVGRQFHSMTVMVRVWVEWRMSWKHLAEGRSGFLEIAVFLALKFLIQLKGSAGSSLAPVWNAGCRLAPLENAGCRNIYEASLEYSWRTHAVSWLLSVTTCRVQINSLCFNTSFGDYFI